MVLGLLKDQIEERLDLQIMIDRQMVQIVPIIIDI
jgi:hypothetical protein